ncbi:hypothetical protein FRX97_10415 [Luteibaculum oceani]|uniref:Uncharacterized protein n=2 Tax=Luteibaculum oceani TaxID=1294296 RepID=A0A5C6UVK5_9FLAO|nr:hypothetical protein [Luteibaculum oceani]TXC76156.1 hypothetical protein FRX97_10415 [Luteibaculum oceani]
MAKTLQNENREVEAININQARKLGLLFDATHAEQLEQARQLKNEFKSKYPNLEFIALGWYQKEIPKTVEKEAGFSFFNKSDYSFFYKPKESSKSIKNFLTNKYDIVLDLTMDFNFPIKRIIVETDAKLRVGVFSKYNEPFFDLFINTRKNVKEFAQQAIYYLGVLNK